MSLSIFIAGFLAGAGLTAGLRLRRERLDLGILFYLHEHGESYALPMVDAGHGQRGTIYVRLARLESEGLIEGWWDERPEVLALRDWRPRRMYRLTEAGRAALTVEVARSLAAKREREESL